MRRALLLGLLLGGCFAEATPLPANYTDPGQRSHAFVSIERDHDEDFSADRHSDPAPPDVDPRDAARVAGFSSTSAALVSDNRHVNKDPIPFEQALKCVSMQQDAADKAPACAAEILVGNCSRGDAIRQSECPDCYALNKADRALALAGCPARPIYPPLREQ